MVKQIIYAVLAVFVAWAVMDFLLHGWLLMDLYEANAHLWRPMEEMNMALIYFVTLVTAVSFVLIYELLIDRKSLKSGLQYGALFGLAAGISMGLGSYSYMPIPMALAMGWFLGIWLEAIAAGAIVGSMLKSY